MGNIIAIAKTEIRNLFSNVATVVIFVGLVVLPSVFGWGNVLACWDVFGNAGNLTVAVANADAGYKSDVIPVKVNVGDQVVSALRENHQINWVFVSKDEAIDGTAAGRYYAGLVIPESFSADILTFGFMEGDTANITYYINEKKNAVAPKITSQGASSLSYQINAAFGQTVLEVAVDMVQSMGDYLDSEEGVQAVAKLSQGMGTAATRMRQASQMVTLYAGSIGASANLAQSTEDLAFEVSTQMDAALVSARQSTDAVVGLTQGLKDMGQFAAEDVTSVRERIQTVLELAQELGAADVAQAALEVLDIINDIDALGQTQVLPRLDELAAAAQSMRDKVEAFALGMQDVSVEVEAALQVVIGETQNSYQDLSEIAQDLNDGADELDALSQSVSEALVSGDMARLRQMLSGDSQSLAEAFTQPIAIERHALYEYGSFGSAMTPLYCTMALFVGALLIMVAIKPRVSARVRAKLTKPKDIELLVGHFGVAAFISTLQSLLLALGDMLFLEVHVVHPVHFILCLWIAGMVFAFIVYVLVTTFGNLGKGIAVLILVAQITGCGGSYPLQLLPGFVQGLSPFLPATHVVNAMRAAMMGIYQGDFWMHIGSLLLFVVPFALIGLVFAKPMGKLMEGYLKRVEKAKILN